MSDLMAVMIGVVCGILASIPASILITVIASGMAQDHHRDAPMNIVVIPPQCQYDLPEQHQRQLTDGNTPIIIYNTEEEA